MNRRQGRAKRRIAHRVRPLVLLTLLLASLTWSAPAHAFVPPALLGLSCPVAVIDGAVAGPLLTDDFYPNGCMGITDASQLNSYVLPGYVDLGRPTATAFTGWARTTQTRQAWRWSQAGWSSTRVGARAWLWSQAWTSGWRWAWAPSARAWYAIPSGHLAGYCAGELTANPGSYSNCRAGAAGQPVT